MRTASPFFFSVRLPGASGGARHRTALFLLFLLLCAPLQTVAAAAPDVEIFVTNWCPYCKKAISFFEDRGIRPRVYNIERDTLAAERKLRLDPRRGVPLAVINGQIVYGFSPRAYVTALDD